jgi:hypothetical protein
MGNPGPIRNPNRLRPLAGPRWPEKQQPHNDLAVDEVT